jgi:hypothetical protein
MSTQTAELVKNIFIIEYELQTVGVIRRGEADDAKYR